MYNLDFTNDVLTFLDKLDAKQFRQIIKKVFGLMKNPFPTDSENLRGNQYKRVDAGEYRIVYLVDDNILKIVTIGKRNDSEVYRRLKRSKK
ncbi:type II toxin-antitoxin system RelE/ParE family toxin [Candidatus Magnetomonas plexicatena]|nr:type II toxin-antitoxin system RelE/ParE family toxin [Nitrospirales bacterium LBB_01]